MMSGDAILVIDLGTTSVRLSLVDEHGNVFTKFRAALPTFRERPGEVVWDGNVIAQTVLKAARAVSNEQALMGIALATQRASCLLWDAETSDPIGPVLSWSDGRTRQLDRDLRASGVRHTPGLSASKLRWLLDSIDPDRKAAHAGRIRGGTLDTWLAWILSSGKLHITDHTNASHTGIFNLSVLDWDSELTEMLNIPRNILAYPLPSTGPFGNANALPGSPPILAISGDQQASLMGQGCVDQGTAKITFGTGGIINTIVGSRPLAETTRSAFANIAHSTQAGVIYGAETAIFSAGSAIEWLIRLGVLGKAGSIDNLVDPCHKSGTAIFVSALDGLGAPYWKSTARGAFMGLSSSDEPGDMVRAVLDGIVCATADVLDRIEADIQENLTNISIDGGLSNSAAFCSILKATTNRSLHRAIHVESTTIGVAILAFQALGRVLPVETEADTAAAIAPAEGTIPADRKAWADAIDLVLEDDARRKIRLDLISS
ncbi:MAG: FGGY family carbohydrate kinase [Sneathiella sp.]|uniref:FGGY family carbohydrate kinase n=1 Tax=Sneathiella sp. TaxID=1964365 RepID=UPI00300324BE